jgi:plasmid stability protein
MVFHMKTTLNIEDALMRQLKVEAARQGRTMTRMVEEALRAYLEPTTAGPKPLRPLPTFSSEILVDIADRDALYDAMDEW